MEELEPRAFGWRHAEHARHTGEVGFLVVEAGGRDKGDSPALAQEIQDLASALRPAVEAERSSRMQQDAHQGVYVSRRRRSWLMDFTT